MALVLTLVLSALAGLLTAVLLFYSWHFNYWKQRGVPYFNPSGLSTVIASRLGSLTFLRPFYLMLEEAYWQFPDQPFVGFFQARRPAVVVRDPELVKLVLTKEFSSFHDRGFPVDEKNDPFSVNLVTLGGERWKNLRTKLSPAFTSGKLKLMFHLMKDVAEELKTMVKRSSDAGEEIELKNLLMRYSTDIIGSCAFGVNCNSLQDPQSEFFLMGKSFSDQTSLFTLRFLLNAISPVLLRLLPFQSVFCKPHVFFTGLMKETIRFREEHNVERNDFVSLMMKLRDADVDDVDRSKHVRFDDEHMVAEAFVFFSAALDAVSNIPGFCFHALAYDPELQRRTAEQVRDVVRKHDGVLSYEALREMDLVERVVFEALRLYGPSSFMSREVTKPIKLPNSDLLLDGTAMVFVPVRQLHRDPAYFPDPERFDPDRFTEEAKQARHPYVFLPFGEGPRFCIAERFAMLEMKLVLASLLHDFHFSPGPKSEADLEMNPRAFSPAPKNGFRLKVEERGV